MYLSHNLPGFFCPTGLVMSLSIKGHFGHQSIERKNLNCVLLFLTTFTSQTKNNTIYVTCVTSLLISQFVIFQLLFQSQNA